MNIHAIEISTEVFHLLQRQAPWRYESAEPKPGPTQTILLPDDVYVELIDRAIAHRQTLDDVVREICDRMPKPTEKPDASGFDHRVNRSR